MRGARLLALAAALLLAAGACTTRPTLRRQAVVVVERWNARAHRWLVDLGWVDCPRCAARRS